MTWVCVDLTPNIARAILTDIVSEETKGIYASNKGWSWWAYDARTDVGYEYRGGVVKVVQTSRPEEWQSKDEGDTEIVFEFSIGSADPVFFRIQGEFTSYSGDTWNVGSFREVRPTEVVRRVFEVVK